MYIHNILDDDNSRNYKSNKEIEMKVSKTKFYMMLEMCRIYYKKGGKEWLDLIINIGEDIGKEAKVSWVILTDIAHQMARLHVNDTNCQKIMELFGFELE